MSFSRSVSGLIRDMSFGKSVSGLIREMSFGRSVSDLIRDTVFLLINAPGALTFSKRGALIREKISKLTS